ncbi:MAG TPA: FtsX-like permease family protein [Actinomycetes bacterium]|jgi:putative ABC transport system permease protein|nr:FtsX-like permease family protein [Actinomycetes bacterium]
MYPNLTPYLVGLGAAALAVAAFLVLRGPLTRRLALRQVNRRRGEAALVIAGSVLGTAIIVGSLVVGDTLDHSFKRDAYRTLGVVDEVVSSPDPAKGAEASRRLETLRGDPAVDGLLTVRRHGAAVASDGGHGGAARKGEPQATVLELDFPAAARFEGPGSALAGPAPGRGRVVLNDTLAGALDARAGDRLTFYLHGHPVALEVARVVPTRGLAGFGDRGAFVEPGTLHRVAGGAGARAGPETLTLVSNAGGVEGGAAATDQVVARLQAALGPLTAAGTAVETPKQEVLEQAESIGGEIGSLFLFIGSFAIIAGVMLLVNVFVMLAEERKPELGMLRAVGMRRGRLVRGFIIEGTVYALVASALGVAAGLGVGRAVVEVTARIFADAAAEDGGLHLTYTVTSTSLINGFAAGFLIGFLTVALTSIRISRINIIAAIRDLPPEAGRRLRWRWVLASTLAAAGFGAAAVVAIAGSQGVGTYLYPALAVVALCPLLVRLLPRRAVYTGASLAVLGWGLAANTVRPKVFDDGSTVTFIVLGVVLTFSAVLLVSQNQELLLRLARALPGRPSASRLASRLAVAYPVARRFRTGATLIMYGLVVFTLVLISVLGSVIGSGVDQAVTQASGGYALRVDYNPSAAIGDPAARLAGGRFAGQVEGVAPLASAEARVQGVPGAPKPVPTTAVGATPALAEHGLFPLDARLGRLGGDDRAVWRAVLADPGYVILDQWLGQEDAGIPAVTYRPGDTVTIVDPASGRREPKVIAGIVADSTAFDALGVGDGEFGSPVIMAAEGLRAQFGDRGAPSAALLRLAPGVSDRAVAADLQGEFLPQGLVATRIRHVVERDFAANRSFFQLLQGFLALGLVVGVAGLGVVMVRAVRERRRTVGVLRALGFPARVVRRAFLLESSFVALEGILLGTALSIVTSYLLFRNDDDLQATGSGFPIPWMDITILVAATAAASLAATAWPARQAARIKPAVALRIAD